MQENAIFGFEPLEPNLATNVSFVFSKKRSMKRGDEILTGAVIVVQPHENGS